MRAAHLSLFVPPYPPSNVVSRPSRRDEAARALTGIYQTASDNASGWCGVLPNSLSVCTGTKATSRHCTEARPRWLIGLSYEYSGVSQSSQAVPSVTHKTSCRCICSPFQHPQTAPHANTDRCRLSPCHHLAGRLASKLSGWGSLCLLSLRNATCGQGVRGTVQRPSVYCPSVYY